MKRREACSFPAEDRLYLNAGFLLYRQNIRVAAIHDSIPGARGLSCGRVLRLMGKLKPTISASSLNNLRFLTD